MAALSKGLDVVSIYCSHRADRDGASYGDIELGKFRKKGEEKKKINTLKNGPMET